MDWLFIAGIVNGCVLGLVMSRNTRRVIRSFQRWCEHQRLTKIDRAGGGSVQPTPAASPTICTAMTLTMVIEGKIIA
jgi:hypothetical protein